MRDGSGEILTFPVRALERGASRRSPRPARSSPLGVRRSARRDLLRKRGSAPCGGCAEASAWLRVPPRGGTGSCSP
eukprot:13222915-Alexandrium_andersonii.AAC.1